jgi:hypothetical protein
MSFENKISRSLTTVGARYWPVSKDSYFYKANTLTSKTVFSHLNFRFIKKRQDFRCIVALASLLTHLKPGVRLIEDLVPQGKDGLAL